MFQLSIIYFYYKQIVSLTHHKNADSHSKQHCWQMQTKKKKKSIEIQAEEKMLHRSRLQVFKVRLPTRQ